MLDAKKRNQNEIKYVDYDKNYDKFKDLEKSEIVKNVKTKFGTQSTAAALAPNLS